MVYGKTIYNNWIVTNRASGNNDSIAWNVE